MKLLAVLLIILSTVSADENKYEQIANLLTDDQPENGKYQVRQYPGGENLVCTNIRAMKDRTATVIGKRRLHRYFNGSNSEGIQIKSGQPFIVLHSKRECVGYCSKYFKVCMMIGAEHQNNPPKPISHNIFFVPVTPMIGNVWLFKNKQNKDWNYQMSEFAKVLGEEQLSKTYNFFYALTFDNHPISPHEPLQVIVIIEKSPELDRFYYDSENFGFFFNN